MLDKIYEKLASHPSFRSAALVSFPWMVTQTERERESSEIHLHPIRWSNYVIVAQIKFSFPLALKGLIFVSQWPPVSGFQPRCGPDGKWTPMFGIKVNQKKNEEICRWYLHTVRTHNRAAFDALFDQQSWVLGIVLRGKYLHLALPFDGVWVRDFWWVQCRISVRRKLLSCQECRW